MDGNSNLTEDWFARFRYPLEYEWKPKPDITTYELALALPYILGNVKVNSEDKIPEEVRRHLIIYNPNE